jgi:fatty-acyl-CoA synthase
VADPADLSFEPLTPISFLERSALVFGDRLGVVSGAREFTYREHWERARKQAGLWQSLGVRPGDRVAVLSPNTHVLLESHVGVPLAGAVLVALNTRLQAAEVAGILDHSGAGILLVDHELHGLAVDAAALSDRPVKMIVAEAPGDDEYERLLLASSPARVPVADERALLSINYTSGTTGAPKGVMYHHRGAYLQAMAMALHSGMNSASRYLWTLPMFHTNGWCFPWAVTAAGAVHLCLRRPDASEIWRAIEQQGVTHLAAAPTVLGSMESYEGRPETAPRPILAMAGGAPPTPALLKRFAGMRLRIVQLYGLTETFGPAVVSEWYPEWDELDQDEQAILKARQGVQNIVAQRVRVVGPDGHDVPSDGATQGEIALRGNNVMLGYYRDPDATRRAAPDGWFRTGDVGVMHDHGFVEIRDRLKDVIISGGENIASIEVEKALSAHPAVLEAAVVARPHEKWGEVPVAFVTLRGSATVTEQELIEHVRSRLAHFKAPKAVTFGPLPRTSTGKVQKNLLRESVSDDGLSG